MIDGRLTDPGHASGSQRLAALSRRSLLVAGGAAVTAASLAAALAGCDAASTDTAATTPAPLHPLTPVLLGQRLLLATYAQTLSTFPELTPTLTDLQAQSAAHNQALLDASPAAAAQIASPTGSAVPSPTSTAPASAPDAPTALSHLARAVVKTSGSLRAAALRADGELAALLGSCAASTACHARLLGR
ncbi:MAG: hypothetical protein M3400_14185 [Actinomycetota bacterium]|nr:hypothetical protein [Actinomycetota bacterium]